MNEQLMGNFCLPSEIDDTFINDEILRNGTIDCKKVHGISPVTTTDEHGIPSFRIYFSDVDDKTVKELNVETKVAKRLAGTGRAGSEDGCQTTAQFQQPTSVCSEKKNRFYDAISRLADIDDFLCLCDIEIKTMTSEKHPLQGPNSANSMQTKHDISQLITALKSLRDVVSETEPLFKAKFLLKSTSTTIVENLSLR
ncbi:unnamed protein product [Mytilus coruscus]|uniref:Uncharacterized protein n=1 Tax=Mytilus coruscus TaxID=42192 RepID=A0A6J8A015_MYTCO|nr:unnamed protein product [Mytilus coruscus]